MGQEYSETTSRHLVITVHGIRTYGQWQSRLKELLERTDPRITVRNEKYGHFSILAFIFPPTRWLVTRRFRRQLLNVIQSNSWSRIDLVGHSFGTHMLAWALNGIAKEERPRIHTIILAGSVLKFTFPWDQFIGDSVKRLVNECGIRDRILLLNQLVVLFTGMAGRIGFHGMTGDNFQNRYYQFGHSDYFLKDGQLNSEFMRQAWVPLLTTDGPIPEVDQRERPQGLRGALVGFELWALNNAEPIKLAFWMTPVVLVLLYVHGLYNNAEEQRQLAQARTQAMSDILEKTSKYYRRRIGYQLEVVRVQVDKDFDANKQPVIDILGINALGPIHQGRELLIDIINKNAKIRLLLLDPTSPAFKKRMLKENDSLGMTYAELQASLYILSDIKKQVGNKFSNLELRFHNKEPKCSLVMINANTDQGIILENPYPKIEGTSGLQGEMLKYIQGDKDAHGYQANLNYFMNLWNEAKRIDLTLEPCNPSKWPYKEIDNKNR